MKWFKSNKKEFKKTVVPDAVTGSEDFQQPTLLDNISNEGIEFERDYFIVATSLGGCKFGRSFYLKPSGFPANVHINWLEGLLVGDDMDSSTHIEPLDRTDAVSKLKQLMDKYETVIHSAESRGDHHKYDAAMKDFHDTKALRDQILANTNALFYVSISSCIYADSLYELNQKSVNLERVLAGHDIELIKSFGRQREGWLSTLPLATNYLAKSYRNLDRYALTAIFPHVSSKLNHMGGFPIGIAGREYIFFNNFEPSFTNYNMGIFGQSGAGKGVLVKTIIGRGFLDGIKKNVIIDVEPEYVGLTERLGGISIPLRSDRKENLENAINPLDIYVTKEVKNRYQVNEYVVEQINVYEKVKEVIEFFKVMRESATPMNPYLSPIELNCLDKILIRLYTEDCGITEKPDSLYEIVDDVADNGEIIYKSVYKRMPQISDVHREIVALMEKGQEGLEELKNILELFCQGGSFGMFDCQTLILNNEGEVVDQAFLDNAPIINFDISRLSSNSIERPLAQHVLMTWIWNRFVVNDPKAKKRIIQDEAWMMLEYPAMIDFFKNLSARGRKWNVSLTLVSQRYEMFDRIEAAQDVVAQLSCLAFMKQPDQDIEAITKTFKFSDEVAALLRTSERGDVILKAGKEIVHFISEPTPSEWKYINTNQNISTESLIGADLVNEMV